MKNPFSNETVKSAAIVIGSAAAFIALSKGVSILRKKFGGKHKLQPIFGAQEKAENAAKPYREQFGGKHKLQPIFGAQEKAENAAKPYREKSWEKRNESVLGKSAVSDCAESECCECGTSR